MRKCAYEYVAIVRDVYDGDTITIDIDVGFGIWLKEQKVRLYGINTPEIRTVNAEEKIKGLAVRDYVSDAILGKTIIIRTLKDKKGKFGRWLASIFYGQDHKNLNAELIDKSYARRYLIDRDDESTMLGAFKS